MTVSACCSEPVSTRGACAGCGELVAECRDCGGEGVVEEEYGSQAGRDEPRTRVVACPTCSDGCDYDDREPDHGSAAADYDTRLARMGAL